jgi:hypothetical protein
MGLRKTMKNLRVSATIQTEDFTNTNQEHYCLANLLSMTNAKLTFSCVELLGSD